MAASHLGVQHQRQALERAGGVDELDEAFVAKGRDELGVGRVQQAASGTNKQERVHRLHHRLR